MHEAGVRSLGLRLDASIAVVAVIALLFSSCGESAAKSLGEAREPVSPAASAGFDPPELPDLDELRALPYLTHSAERADTAKSGVTVHDPARAFEGYTFLDFRLIDMEGTVVHQWPWCLFAELTEDGHLIAPNGEDLNACRLSFDGEVVWERSGLKIHHEATLTPRDSVLTVTKDVHDYRGRRVEFDVVVELSLEDGSELARWSTFENLEHLQGFHRASRLDQPATVEIPAHFDERPSPYGGDYDYYHLNSIQVLPDTDLGRSDERFRAGNLLISLPFFDLVAVLDQETWRVRWTWGPGEIEVQHDPRMLPGGTILIFDNGKWRKWTRVVEVDPKTGRIVWEYRGDPPASFFSATRGSAQRLPNGNTVIAESDNGRVIEVTRDGEIVWEWHNPQLNDAQQRRSVYRARRFSKDSLDALLAGTERAPR